MAYIEIEMHAGDVYHRPLLCATLLKRSILASSLLLFLVAARPHGVRRPLVVDPPPQDIFSAAQPSQVQTRHLALDLNVDFDARQIHGSATHTIVNFTGTRQLVLDTRDLDITAITIDGEPATWIYGTPTNTTVPLVIDIEPWTRVVKIAYATSPTAAGLYWLTAKQTLGDEAPFMFTETEPIGTRSWIPVQDTPAVRMTYEATIRVPPGMLALMTALNPTAPNESGVYTFRMDKKLPPYLIALAVGRLTFHAFDERSGAYAEPELIDDVAWEMQFVPDLIDAAESILGPHPFARYDLLFPPGFVVGGMENPRLTFLNPGLILGNHEWPVPINAYVAHELAHSWGGDLVTCATWSDTWLNEGFAAYYEKRFYEAMGLDERAELGYFWDRVSFAAAMGSLAPQSTVLHRVFTASQGPGSAFNTASYQKGALFLKTIDDVVGREAFDGFIASYLRRNAFHWVDDLEFLEVLGDTALDGRPDLELALQLDEWIYGTGLPSNVTAPTRSVIQDRVETEAYAFLAGAPASSLDTAGWGTLETVIFLGVIQDIISTRMPELDLAFGFSLMRTPPVTWLVVTAQTMYAPSIPTMERFLMTGLPNILPIYYRLAQTSAGLAYARKLYALARDEYPPNIQAYLDQLLYGLASRAAA